MTVVRPALVYGAETRVLKKTHENKLDVAEKRMLRWMSRATKHDRIRNDKNNLGQQKWEKSQRKSRKGG